jgi:hypothetical protein
MASSDAQTVELGAATKEQQADERNAPNSGTQAEAPWSTAHKVTFRFVFCYFALYIAFVMPYILATFAVKGKLPWNSALYERVWLKVVPWVGAHILRHPIIGFGDTSDSAYDYVKLFSFILFAAIATIIWSILDRKRTEYSKLDQWLRLSVRLVLAYAMFFYGGIKVMPSQMAPASISRMIQPFGDITPYDLLWNFMGASTGYEVLCGLVEMSCGIVLLIPGMTMLGALLSLAAVGNVIVLNVSYDVAVKLIPVHFALFALYLLVPYIPQIVNFVLNRPVQLERRAPLFRRRGLNYLAWSLQWTLGMYFIVSTLLVAGAAAKGFREGPLANPLHGIWAVDEFAANGQVRPPLLTDNLRWQRVVVDSQRTPRGKATIAVQWMSGKWSACIGALDEHNGSLVLRNGKGREIADWVPSSSVDVNSCDGTLNYTRPRADELVLQGLVNGDQLRVTLRKEDRRFLLNTYKFGWVHETYPY